MFAGASQRSAVSVQFRIGNETGMAGDPLPRQRLRNRVLQFPIHLASEQAEPNWSLHYVLQPAAHSRHPADKVRYPQFL
jgi:hypothetical protein